MDGGLLPNLVNEMS